MEKGARTYRADGWHWPHGVRRVGAGWQCSFEANGGLRNEMAERVEDSANNGQWEAGRKQQRGCTYRCSSKVSGYPEDNLACNCTSLMHHPSKSAACRHRPQ